jgi:lipopolysaccharide/colanic/teichoic acid biosynthesis glycosyltransferase
VNTIERSALQQGLQLYDEMNALVDERTLDIVDRRRRTAVVKRRGWLVRRMLVLADLAGLALAMIVAAWTTRLGAADPGGLTVVEVAVGAALLPGWVVLGKLYGLYDRDEERTDHSTIDDVVGVFHLTTIATWLLWVGAYVSGVAHPPVATLLVFWAAATTFISVARSAARARARRNVLYLQNTVIVGAGEVGQLLAEKILQSPQYGINLLGFIDAEPRERLPGLGHLAMLGGPERLPAIIRLFDIERVIVAFSNTSHQETLRLVQSVKHLNVQVDIVPRLFDTLGPTFGLHMVEGLPLVGLPRLPRVRSSLALKRALDVTVGTVALVGLAPVLAVVALTVAATTGGAVFDRAERVGLGGRRFELLAFRTRGTRAGAFLRRTGLDQLALLLNLVRGDVSLVGPSLMSPAALRRGGAAAEELLTLRPGIVNYWHVSDRSRRSDDDRLRLDLSYIHGWSLQLDLQILTRALCASR